MIDRVVQQACLQILELLFDPDFHNSSHGYRRKRGAQTAIAQAKDYVAAGCTVTVDIDLSTFFDRFAMPNAWLAELGLYDLASVETGVLPKIT